MSMRNFGNHGHTVLALKLTELLPTDKRLDYLNFLRTGDLDAAGDLLSENLPKKFPCPELFLMRDEYESEQLEVGEIYAMWNPADLFVITERPELKALKKKGIDPELSNWVSWN